MKEKDIAQESFDDILNGSQGYMTKLFWKVKKDGWGMGWFKKRIDTGKAWFWILVVLLFVLIFSPLGFYMGALIWILFSLGGGLFLEYIGVLRTKDGERY